MTRPLAWEHREDVTDEVIDDPSFWATFRITCRGGGDHEFFDTFVEADPFYESFLTRRIERGVWPYLRSALDERRYVEVEFTDDHEERYWIGTTSPPWRALLGYHSGCFSLPAFRPEELAWLADRLPADRQVLAACLIKGCYFPAVDPSAQELLWRLVDLLPGLRRDMAQELVAVCLNDQVHPGVVWTKDRRLGWVNNDDHSARQKPKGLLSTLLPTDYASISRFFL